MNIHHLARKICKKEAGKRQVDISQVKEILKVMVEIDNETNGKVSEYFEKRLK